MSYVRFLDGETIVSASTDSQLKVWDVNQCHAKRSLSGHVNDKNFVGLAAENDFIACGSENNSLYVYYKVSPSPGLPLQTESCIIILFQGLQHPVLSYNFGAVTSMMERTPRDVEEAHEFVSAVCWKPDSDILIGANSQGIVKILQLV